MGEPGCQEGSHRKMNQIVLQEGTRGTETSKYPEEKKERSIPVVAASEEGRGQTGGLRTSGVAGRRHPTIADLKRLERRTEESDSLVREGEGR